MLDNLPHSEDTSVKDNLKPESNGQNHDAPELATELEETTPEEVDYLKILTEIGNAASRESAPAPIVAGPPIIESGEDLGDQGEAHKIEIFGDTEESARKVAEAVVETANNIYSNLHALGRRRTLNTEPASPLLLSGKLLTEIVREQASGGTERDTYEHADEAVSMLSYAWRLYFGHDEDDMLDKIRFLAYIHDFKQTVPEEVQSGKTQAETYIHISPLVIKNVLEKLGVNQADAEEIMRVNDLLAQVPNPRDETKSYLPSIENGIDQGGLMFILTKFACIQDMMFLEQNSPLKEVSLIYGEGKFDQRLIAKTRLTRAAEDYGEQQGKEILLFGLIPGTIETVNRGDLLNIRRNKSHFPLDEVTKSVIGKIINSKS
jgi:hypothetical protein